MSRTLPVLQFIQDKASETATSSAPPGRTEKGKSITGEVNVETSADEKDDEARFPLRDVEKIKPVMAVSSTESFVTSATSILRAGSKRRLQEGEGSSITAATSTTATDTPKLITSFGPAGSKLSVREAGENILNNFCHGYPDTDLSSIIPNFFTGNITELMEPRLNLSKKEERKYSGRKINQEGEGHENAVFNLFINMIRRLDVSPTILIMRSFEMDTKNAVGLKRMALMTELPGLNLNSAITKAENDFVILAKDHGVILLEVKGSTKESNVKSAEKQLENAHSIVQGVMEAITQDKHRTIPIVKLIVIPDCTEPPPEEKTPQGSYFLFKESCDNFEQKWNHVIRELNQIKSTNPFTLKEFKKLSQILVGIWSANAVCVMEQGVQTHHLEQKETDVSYVEQLKKIDTVIDTSNVRDESHFKLNKDKLNPFTDIVRTTEQDIFRSSSDIKLCYLTPTQKNIFDSHKHALIHGAAGAGKSLLILFKVLELVSTSTSNILILAPAPHNIRMYNFLKSNNVSVSMIEELPPSDSAYNVLVMNIKKFFVVKRSTLMDYDLTYYHIFADDVQDMELDREDNKDDGVSYFDVGDFIERTYETFVQNGMYCWFMLDVWQGYRSTGTGKHSGDLFKTHDQTPREYNIPTLHLVHVMRNTYEVMQLANQVRGEYVRTYNSEKDFLHDFPTPRVGHKVTSRRPLYHVLQPGTDDKCKLSFIMDRVREELKSVTNPPLSLSLSSVAIIWNEKWYFTTNKEAITAFLTKEFGTNPQTIEEQLTSNNTTDIIMDVLDNIMSFESPVTVFVCSSSSYGRYHYKICTRARVALTIIDSNGYESWLRFEDSSNIDTVHWKPEINQNDLTFIKYTCKCNHRSCTCK